MHIIFNLLLLWWLGSELERPLGTAVFQPYFTCLRGRSALIYTGSAIVYALVSKKADAAVTLSIPVTGASIGHFRPFGAYGLVFGERIVYFMFFFP